MGTMDDDIHHLGKLTDQECWRLLCHEAFSERNREKFEEFKDISKGIAKKCKGLPLAAKVLGSLLRSKTRLENWENVLNSEIWQLEKAELELFPHLILSYNELSPMQKRCFSYCAIFPKDSRIIVNNLIGKWMALGYLGSNTCDIELKGQECFEVLAMRCLFQDFMIENYHGVEIMSCKMHDIVHDFAKFLRKNGRVDAVGLNSTTCGACDPSLISTVNEFRSFTFEFEDVPRHICSCFKRLRVLRLERFLQVETLIHLRWLYLDGMDLSCEDLKIIFQLYNLQTLSMGYCSLEEIPIEIGNLIQLRSLTVSFSNSLKELRESICSLKELRTLDVEFCRCLIRLPQGMHKLINLKHLQNGNTRSIQYPQGLAELTGLHTLEKFTGGGNGLSKLGLLKNLNLLRGNLRLDISISDDYLEEAVNDAQEVELRKKVHIQGIFIKFRGETRNEAAPTLLGIIDALEPHPNLQRLTIKSYEGLQLPAWITSPSLNHLRIIIIDWCPYISSLPAFGKLLCLEEIHIYQSDGLQFVGREFLGLTTIREEGHMDIQPASTTTVAFPKLKELSFLHCPNWKEWEDITAEEEESADLLFMPCLTLFSIQSCYELSVLPHRLLGCIEAQLFKD